MDPLNAHIGRPTCRIDGRLKVTGQATYAADYDVPGLLHGHIVSSAIAAGRVTAIHTEAAREFPGVIAVYTHENRGKAAWLDRKWRDDVAPPGHPFRPLHFRSDPVRRPADRDGRGRKLRGRARRRRAGVGGI